MKKLLFIAGIVAISATASAQQFGIQAGANMATQKYDFDGEDLDDVKSTVGLVIGAVADVDFGSSISFRPELNFIQKGFKVDDAGKAVLNYIELSPNFVYNVPAGMGKAFFGLGPSFGMGMSGKFKPEDGDDEDINFGDGDDDDFKGFDFGVNLLAGYQMSNGFLVTAGYNLGLANVANTDSDDFSIKNRGFSIRLGYMFGGSKAASSK